MKTKYPSLPGRRRFIGAMATVVSGTAVGQNTPSKSARPHRPATIALSAKQLAWLTAAVGRLIPADEFDGGAVAAHAQLYIDRALSGSQAMHLSTYRSGLAALAALARKEGAHRAIDVPAPRMDTLLSQFEAGHVTEPLTDTSGAPIELAEGGAAFFRLLLRHTLEGTFGDPVHGGNHDFRGWKLLGYSGVQLFYNDSQQAMNTADTRTIRSVSDFGGTGTL